MLSAPELDAIAEEIRTAQRDVAQIEPLTARIAGFDLPSAYDVARRVHAARLADGAVAVGRKIGFTNPALWDRYGVRHPIWGHVYDDTVHRLPANRGRCRIGRFADPKIEPEIVLHFRAAPPAGADAAAILASIDWVAHGFEIVQSHFPGWRFEAADTVADSALHAALLVGEPRAVDELGPDLASRLSSFSLSLSCEGAERDTGRGSNVLGSPLGAIAQLLAVLATQPQSPPLQAGEIVTTGTVTAAHGIRAGEVWQSTLDGIALPGLRVEFTG
jgi:2-keto-4-pentenoate hydratase